MTSLHLESMPKRTKIAGALFIFAFMLKFFALFMSSTSFRWLGYMLFAVAFICLMTSVFLCSIEMKNVDQPPPLKDVEKWMKHYNLNRE